MVEEKFGAEIAYTESVPVSDYEETCNYAVAGYDIIGHGFEFGDTAMKSRPEFQTKFIVTSTNIVKTV